MFVELGNIYQMAFLKNYEAVLFSDKMEYKVESLSRLSHLKAKTEAKRDTKNRRKPFMITFLRINQKNIFRLNFRKFFA